MRRFSLPLSVVLLFALAAPASAQSRRAAARFDGAGEAGMLTQINELRAAANLGPLQRDEGLDEAARAHSRDLAAHSELVHVSERTGTPAARVRDAGVTAARIGENIARHATTAGAFQAIVGSEAHRAQLLEGSFTHVGLAAFQAADGVYVTQVLAVLHAPAELPPPAVEEAELPAPTVEEVPAETRPATGDVTVEDISDGDDQVDAAQALDIPSPPDGMGSQVPRLRVPAGHRNVAGYWVHQQGRWWYFPVPANAQPDHLLMPDLNVEGPPPGVDDATPRAMPARRPQVQRRAVRRPRGGIISPRRGGQIYWY